MMMMMMIYLLLYYFTIKKVFTLSNSVSKMLRILNYYLIFYLVKVARFKTDKK